MELSGLTKFARLALLAVAILFKAPCDAALQEIHADVCIYGGTSGGVIAAVQAARMGKTAALIAVNNHLGGMTSGGLGATDIGRPGNGYIQGTAREFYTRVGAKYGSASAVFAFEPRVAETVFNEMIQEAGVAVYTNQYLQAVQKEGSNIVAITMNNGTLFRARVFIDSTYEGDLMAKAGVGYTVGREAVAQYGESSNGIRPAANNFPGLAVDPYVVPGNPASGLLPLIQPGVLGTIGEADQRLQAFNYRMCLTTNATNRIAITAPPNYNPAQFALLGRYVQAMTAAGTPVTLTTFMSIAQMPNQKTDVNNGGQISTDFVGESAAYVEATWKQRKQIEMAHQNYINGLFHFVGNDLRVPPDVRAQMQAYGYAKDEFVDNGGWPHQLYVREARRMVSDFVMTQAHIMSQAVAPESIGLAAYTSDQHSCGRLVIDGTVVKLPGGGGVPPKPYPISYRAIVPKRSHCSNLLVPWSLSASHVAFCSIRMEPVFMILSQSAATAAALAIDSNVAVQDVDPAHLQAQLLADGQDFGPDPIPNHTDDEVIVDNTDTGRVLITGDWLASASTPGYYGANYLHDRNLNKGASSVSFIPSLPNASLYEVSTRWCSYSNRATNAPIEVVHPAGTFTVRVDQTRQGGEWVTLLTTNFNAGADAKVRIHNSGTTGYVIADAVRFRPVNYVPVVNLWATDARASRFGPHSGSFSLSRSGIADAPLDIRLSLTGTATNGLDFDGITNHITLPAGVHFTNITVRPRTNNLPLGDRTVIVDIVPESTFKTGPLTNAVIEIRDTPINKWRLLHFGTNAANPFISGDPANPSGDGVPNIVKYALGLDPHQWRSQPLLSAGLDSEGFFSFSFTRPDPPPQDIAYLVDSADSLQPWSEEPAPAITGIQLNSNFTLATITFRDAAPIQPDLDDQGYRRLRVRLK